MLSFGRTPEPETRRLQPDAHSLGTQYRAMVLFKMLELAKQCLAARHGFVRQAVFP